MTATSAAFRRLMPQSRTERLRGPLLLGLSVAGIIVAFWFFVIVGPQGMGYDIVAYWDVHLDDVYGRSFGSLETVGAFRYSPVLAFVMAPLHVLPFNVVVVGWTILLVATLWWICGKWTLALLAFPGVDMSIYVGNIDILIAASIVLALRWPAAWAFALLTKVTPGVGVVWHLARREWRKLAIALGVTAILAIPVLVARPDMWLQWVDSLRDNSQLSTGNLIPLIVRLPISALLVAWGARTGRPWVLGVAIAFCEPTLGLRSFTVAVASVGLVRRYGWRGRAPDTAAAPA